MKYVLLKDYSDYETAKILAFNDDVDLEKVQGEIFNLNEYFSEHSDDEEFNWDGACCQGEWVFNHLDVDYEELPWSGEELYY